MDSSRVSVAIVGATGVVGREFIEILEERQFPYSSLKLLASERSAGTAVEVGGHELEVEELREDSFEGVDIALFAAGGKVSEQYAPLAKKAGSIVIDNSSFFRLNEDVPLIVPEVNGKALRAHINSLAKNQGTIIANPNCSTAQLVVILKPLLDVAGLTRVVVSTYQSVSGAGKQGMDELWDQTLAVFNQEERKPDAFSSQIAFNVIPHCDLFLEDGYTKEEMKVVNESRKILSVPDLRITCTAVRVPVFCGHAESVNIEFEKQFPAAQVRELLKEAFGVIVLDDPTEGVYPTPVDLAGTDATYVGRIRDDVSAKHAVNLWIVADNLRKGAALNGVQIAELVLSAKRPH